jgi:hypothetical protein
MSYIGKDQYMDAIYEVLRIIGQSNSPRGWYGIELRLGMKGIILEENLILLLRNLVDNGFLEHIVDDTYPHGIYQLTEKGHNYLNSKRSWGGE